MSVLFLDFEGSERNVRVQKLARTGAHIVASEPRWPAFFELAKREKPYAIAIDFAQAPSHSLETADYLAKAKETRDAAIFLLRVPEDRVDLVAKRLPQATRVTDQELAIRVAEAEKQAQERARQGQRRKAHRSQPPVRAREGRKGGCGEARGKGQEAGRQAREETRELEEEGRPLTGAAPRAKEIARDDAAGPDRRGLHDP
jgi:hypothetical protein